MDESDYEEIISTLAKCGRPDLIATFNEHIRRDYDYRPTAKELREAKQDEEDDSDISDLEEEDLPVVKIDANGLFRLTDSD